MIVDRVDANGTETPNKVEVISFTATSGSTVTTLVRGLAGTTEQDHAVGAIVEFGVDIVWAQGIIDALFNVVDTTGAVDLTKVVTPSGTQMLFNKMASGPSLSSAHLTDPLLSVGSDATGDIWYRGDTGIVTRLALGTSGQVLTANASLPAWADAGGILSTTHYAPRGFLINGKIVPSVSSNNLTVAIKGMDGNDPSASNPVYVRIGDTVRTITAALSVTKNAGTNWFNSGASILATKEVDYFVYLGYNATDGVVIGFARFPHATEYDDFSTTSTNEKYCAISTITNAAAGDDYELIGRFAATLSATASFNWSVPTYTNKNLINYPIFTTRPLDYVPTFSMTNPPSSTTIVAKYILSMHKVYIRFKITGTANAGNAGLSQTITIPFANGVQTLYTAVLANTVWTDTSTFTDIGSGGYWNDTSTINVAQTNATRKPTIISINAVYDI